MDNDNENPSDRADHLVRDQPLTRAEAVSLLEQLLTSEDRPADDVALRRLGYLIDLSDTLDHVDGTETAIARGESLLQRELSTEHRATLHYFLSNAWETKRKLTRMGWALHDWEQPELERQIVHLRHAVQLSIGAELDPVRVCQMYTNLGNLLNHCGRIVAAISSWDNALATDPDFGMALGNRGYGLMHYAELVDDPGHQVFHLREAYASLSAALSPAHVNDVYPEARQAFREALDRLVGAVPANILETPGHTHNFPKGMSRREREYRIWCLSERLFLNDLNDLGTDPIAAADVLTLPSMVTPIDAGQPNAFGFFNQLKQEYVSARYLFYEGTTADRVHFSDRDVTLINTLDYPAYGFAVEKVKIAFRLAYSLLDKVAYFLNDYLTLGIPEKRVSFRGLWYDRQDPSRGLRADLHQPSNTPLKGLFWLAKDLYEKEPGFTEAIEPHAREVAEIRNHLEHKYLKLHLFGPPSPKEVPGGLGYEALAYSIDRSEFEHRTLHLLRTVRAALIHLSQAIHVEERRRHADKEDEKLVAPLYMDTWDDNWKF